MKNFIFPLALIGMITHVASVSAAPSQVMVPGSSEQDFGVVCHDQGKETYSINKNKSNDYRVARNIVFTSMDGGRVAISLLHGFSIADKPNTYLTSSTERCETFQQ